MATDLALRNLTRSVLTFPWAISLFGVQQIVNLLAPPAEGRMAAATSALDAVRRAADRPRGGWREDTWQAVRTVERGLAELAKVRPPSIDSSVLMRLATEPRLAPLVAATAGYLVPPLAWLDSFRIASQDSPALVQEVANKLRIVEGVADARSRLGLDRADDEPLAELLERAADLDPFPRFWAIEALGTWYGNRALARTTKGVDPEAPLTGEATSGIASRSLLMLHAGIGISFAVDALAGLAPASPPAVVRKAITRFIRLCRRSSRRGYAGAALESLGFAARAFRENLVDALDRQIPEVEPEVLGYFWHGAGRAMYFAPANLLPSSNAPRSVIVDLERETPHELAYRNALSGIAWAATLANVQHPEVMEVFLQYHGTVAAETYAFSNGVSSAVIVRRDTIHDDRDVTPFINYEPQSGGAGAAAWRSLVAAPCRAALEHTYGELKRTGTLEELFHYRLSPA